MQQYVLLFFNSSRFWLIGAAAFILKFNMQFYMKGLLKMTDKELRSKVKLLKATDAIKNYAEVAELLEMKSGSFYNWLKDYYSLGAAKK